MILPRFTAPYLRVIIWVSVSEEMHYKINKLCDIIQINLNLAKIRELVYRMNNFYQTILNYTPEKRLAFFVGREQEIKNFIYWCRSVRLHEGAPLVIKGKQGIGKSTLLYFMKEIATICDFPHQYCIDHDWVNQKEYENYIFGFKGIKIMQSKQDSIYDNIYNLGKPKAMKQSFGAGGSAFGFGGSSSVSWKNNVSSLVGKTLKKIAAYKNHPVVFFVDTTSPMGYDYGDDIKFIFESAKQSDINNLNFVVSVNDDDFKLSDYFSNQCHTIDVSQITNDILAEYSRFVTDYYGIEIENSLINQFVHNCAGDMNRLKRQINEFGGAYDEKWAGIC